MKKSIFIAAIVLASTIANAQLGGLLKKAKEKVTQPSSSKSSSTKKEEDKEPSTATTIAQPTNPREVSSTLNTNSNTNYCVPKYYDGQAGKTINDILKNDINVLLPNTAIRKAGETGSAHFAKDYPELSSVIQDKNKSNEFVVEFSNTKSKQGLGKIDTKFSSSKPVIYGVIKTKNGKPIDEIMGFKGKGGNITVQIVIYSNTDNHIGGQKEGSFYGFYVTPELAANNFLYIDILPEAKDAAYRQVSNEKDAYVYLPGFAAQHDKFNFPTSGAYTIQVIVTNNLKNEWGEATKDAIDAVGYFEYDLKVSDIATIEKQKKEVENFLYDYKNNAIWPIPKEWTAKSEALNIGVSQAKLLEMYKNYFKSFDNGFELKKLHVKGNNGWGVVNGDNGLPIYRYSLQWCTAFFKHKNGKACYYQGFGLRQDYQGGGTYGHSYISTDDYHMLDCAEMK
jgi:hypothetical protein